MDRLLPTLSVDITRPADLPGLFGAPLLDYRLEVGFGGGEHLVAQALRHPQIGFIGCEPFRNGVAMLLTQVEAHGCANIRVHAGDGGEIVDWLPPASLARVDLLYPDPWPKRRQRKRRFVSTAMMARLARILRPGGTFRFASDIDDYAGWTLSRLLASPDFEWEARSATDWREPWPDWIRTRYEAKAIREGRPPAYLAFTRR
jgi:tRNA (guanine-N7-)-methyltransferase